MLVSGLARRSRGMSGGASRLAVTYEARGELEEPQGGLPKIFLRPCLLLLLGEGQAHGYDLLVRLTDLGVKVDPGGLYRPLRAFEREGLVLPRGEPSASGPARRTYVLTPEGDNWLRL